MSNLQGSKTGKIRDYYFDNYKAILIMSVVMLHVVTIFNKGFSSYGYFREFMYIYAMPGFSFVSGYFCRKSDFKKSCKSLLVPYISMQFVTILFTKFINAVQIFTEGSKKGTPFAFWKERTPPFCLLLSGKINPAERRA